jgi:multicomponent Na+:H+ antiporter subunit G
MAMAVDILSWALMLAGSFFVVSGAIGMVRMPDIYTRMHALSVVDTAGVGFLVLGMMLQAGFSLVSLKLLFILVLFFFAGPVITHGLAQAALHEKIDPVLDSGHQHVPSAADAASLANRGREP